MTQRHRSDQCVVGDLDAVEDLEPLPQPPQDRDGVFDRWLFPLGEADDVWDEWIVVQNAGSRTVTFSVTALANGQRVGVEGLQDLEVPAGQRRAVRLGEHIKRADLPLVVEATGPVAVERDMYRAKGLATVMVIGTPLR